MNIKSNNLALANQTQMIVIKISN